MQSFFFRWPIVLSLAALVTAAPSMAATNSSLHVVVDPGHGGADKGATRGPATESEIALRVAQQLKSMADAGQKIKVSLTRSTDRSLTLEERVKIADRLKADVFISIHANASKDARARGVEIYFQNHLSPDEESMYLANVENQYQREVKDDIADPSRKGDVFAIVEDLKRQTRMKSSMRLSQSLEKSWNAQHGSIRQAPFFVVSKTEMPSALVEIGFISHPKEGQKLILPEVQKEIAEKILQGLLQYKERVDIARSASLD